MSDTRLIYVTTQSPAQAELLARSLMDDGVVACANILPGMTSVYRWKDDVQTDSETVLILKTVSAHVPRALALIKERHTYEIPCALVLNVEEGLPDYLAWLASGVRS